MCHVLLYLFCGVRVPLLDWGGVRGERHTGSAQISKKIKYKVCVE